MERFHESCRNQRGGREVGRRWGGGGRRRGARWGEEGRWGYEGYVFAEFCMNHGTICRRRLSLCYSIDAREPSRATRNLRLQNLQLLPRGIKASATMFPERWNRRSADLPAPVPTPVPPHWPRNPRPSAATTPYTPPRRPRSHSTSRNSTPTNLSNRNASPCSGRGADIFGRRT